MTDERRSGRALIEVTPQMMERLRDPRTLLGFALVAAGAVAVVVGYFGVSGTLDPGKQLPYIISGGIGGVFLLGCGAMLIFSGDLAESRHQIEDMHDRIDDLQRQVALLVERSAPPANPVQDAEPGDSTIVFHPEPVAGGNGSSPARVPVNRANGANGANGSKATEPSKRRRPPRAATTEDA